MKLERFLFSIKITIDKIDQNKEVYLGLISATCCIDCCMLDLTKLASSFSYVLPASKLSVLLSLPPCSTPVVPLLLLNELEYGLSGNCESSYH